MAFSVDGLVSGLDATSLVSQIISLERRPIDLLEDKQEILTNQKDAWQEISKMLLAFESEANDLRTAGKFAKHSTTFSGNNANGGSVLSANAGSDVSTGSYDFVVSQLADAQKSVSNESYSSSTTALSASGTITIGGSYNVTVALTDSLEDIKNNINSSGAGVVATVINSGTSGSPAYKLIVTGDDTGSANSFSITDATDGTTNVSFGITQSAQDAAFTIDGISVTKDTNSFTDVIANATISLETIGSGALTFQTDNDAIVAEVQEFVDAYNTAMKYIADQLTYDQSLDTKGALFGNAALLTIQTQLRSIVTSAVPGIDTSNLSYLSQVGISTDDTNTLTLDTSKLKDKLQSNFTDVQNLFATSGSGTYTFVATSGNTVGGTYDTQVVDDGSGGALVQMRLAGTTGDWMDLSTTGNFSYGANGTDLEGLAIRTGSIAINDTGQMRIAVGVAQSVATNTGSYTEYSTAGLIFNQNDLIADLDKEYQDHIEDLEERLLKKEKDLKMKFVKLETLLAKLSSQQTYLDSQLSNLSRGWKF